MADTYLTVATPCEGVYKEKMSRFLAFVHPADTPEEARTVIAAYQKKYHDARHVCWAYAIGVDRTQQQCSDNGEPSGTAGRPIAGAIVSAGLTNVVAVVVRYFGGIKLGTGGLVVAYREAVREALSSAQVVERHTEGTLSFHFPYIVMNDVMKAVKDSGARIVSQEFDNSCSMTLSLREDSLPALTSRLTSIDGLTTA